MEHLQRQASLRAALPSCLLPAALQGEVLVAAGDRPPAVGVHIYRSDNGGDSFQDITDAAFAGETAEVSRAGAWPAVEARQWVSCSYCTSAGQPSGRIIRAAHTAFDTLPFALLAWVLLLNGSL